MLTLATSVQQPDTVTFYNFVVFIHILAAIVAFGVTASYPIVDARAASPREPAPPTVVPSHAGRDRPQG